MARITDINRIERLKSSTMKLVVEKGFGGASAAMIANDAKVAVGYFYMHYKGKYEMVNTMLHDVFQETVYKLEENIDEQQTFLQIVDQIVEHIFKIANEDPVKMKFLYVLSNDYSFVIDAEVRNKVFSFLKKIKELGQSSQTIDKSIKEEDLYLLLVVNTIQFINLRFKFFPVMGNLSDEDKNHLLYMVYKVLKENS